MISTCNSMDVVCGVVGSSRVHTSKRNTATLLLVDFAHCGNE